MQIAVRRRNHAHVDLRRPRRADRLELPLLEHAQQLHLHVERQLADLVEEDRPVVRELEPPRLALDRAGERALLVTEELALGERRRNARRSSP